MSANRIEKISGLETLKTLEELNLSSNFLEKVSKNCLDGLISLKKLNLSYNRVDNISGFETFQVGKLSSFCNFVFFENEVIKDGNIVRNNKWPA